jgi:hypothetical protein
MIKAMEVPKLGTGERQPANDIIPAAATGAQEVYTLLNSA